MLFMKLIKKRTKKKITFTILMFVSSPFLILYFLLLTIFGLLLSPLEYLIYKSISRKYGFVGKYYPLVMKFERLIYKSIKKLNKLNYTYLYNTENKVIYINDFNMYLIFGVSNKRFKTDLNYTTINKIKDIQNLLVLTK